MQVPSAVYGNFVEVSEAAFLNLNRGGAKMMGVQFGTEHVIMKQHTSQFCRFCCCQPNIHWDLLDWQEGASYNALANRPVRLHVKEEAPYIGRCCSYCYPGARSTTYTVYEGASDQGRRLMTHEKSCTCPISFLILQGDGGPVRCPCCCPPLPNLVTKDSAGAVLGETKYVCDMCCFIPKYDVFDSAGHRLYRIRPDTCCGGVCPRCRCCDGKGSKKCLRIPFPIRDPETGERIGDAVIGDLWAGLAAECCTQKNLYEIKFPKDSAFNRDPEKVMATLIGASLLIDLTVFEQDL